MPKPDPIRDPDYRWPSASVGDSATPIQRALGALKMGALLAGAVTIVLMYARTYAGVAVPGGLASAAVLAAFLLPSLSAWLAARRRARRAPANPPDGRA
ncbi:MAG: hypothetical protein ACO21O_11845 [Steroidobacteraceae bacterium]|jgi:hypothetical protein